MHIFFFFLSLCSCAAFGWLFDWQVPTDAKKVTQGLNELGRFLLSTCGPYLMREVGDKDELKWGRFLRLVLLTVVAL